MPFNLKFFDSDLTEHKQLAIDRKEILFICPNTSSLRLGKLKYTDLKGFDFIEVEIINQNDRSCDWDYKSETHQVTHNTLFTEVEII